MEGQYGWFGEDFLVPPPTGVLIGRVPSSLGAFHAATARNDSLATEGLLEARLWSGLGRQLSKKTSLATHEQNPTTIARLAGCYGGFPTSPTTKVEPQRRVNPPSLV